MTGFRFLLVSVAALSLLAARPSAATDPGSSPGLFGKFVGSTPRGAEVAAFLSLAVTDEVECSWTIELFENADQMPATYKLTCEHGKYSYQKPKVEQQREAVSKQGTWKLGTSEKAPHLRTFELEGGLTLVEVSKNVVHFAGATGAPLIGGSGYSYTLYRAEATEKPGDWRLAMAKPDGDPYKIAPVSTGAKVFGVFEGRTPYKGIAEQLQQPWDEGNLKAKWRLTLYQDEKTKAPTEYKIEGTLFKPDSRTGRWSIEKSTDGKLTRLILGAASGQSLSGKPAKGQADLVLLTSDEDVLFIADAKGEPLVGHADFSYTLNRRSEEK